MSVTTFSRHAKAALLREAASWGALPHCYSVDQRIVPLRITAVDNSYHVVTCLASDHYPRRRISTGEEGQTHQSQHLVCHVSSAPLSEYHFRCVTSCYPVVRP